MVTKKFIFIGNIESFTVPAGVASIDIKIWGAGGASSNFGSPNGGTGGAGGYASGTLNVSPGQILSVIVGEGGKPGNSSGTINPGTFGGGGAGGTDTTTFIGASGGGRSAVRIGNLEVITGGAGGGCGGFTNTAFSNGGNGGGLSGNDAVNQSGSGLAGTVIAKGGSQTTGGAAGTTTVIAANGFNGSQYQGGAGGRGQGGSSGGGGGAGGGYYGGGGGAGEAVGNGFPQETAGAGGSSYIGGVLNGITASSPQKIVTNTTSVLPPNTIDIDYITGVGVGAAQLGTAGGNGLVVFSYTIVPVKITKNVDKTIVTTGDVLTYTMEITNFLGTTITNGIFKDTIPIGTTFVADTVTIDGITQLGVNPEIGGIAISNIANMQVLTITFKVKVL
ncbi:MAG: DUF11 domain-containing protein [Clostridium sp.]|uniref:DUF11 domain-containing protein n=1 Tax=Clostridium sp. TaxID=1506 RepID=UPI003F35B801